jgi:hypothetical protein
MEAGTKITVTLKDGSKIEGTFVDAKGGWTNYTTADGGAAKARSKDVEVFMTKEEKKIAAALAKQEAKDKAAAEKQATKDKAAAEKQATKDKAAAEKAKAKAATAKVKKEPVEGEDEEGDARLVPADLSRYTLHETKTASGRKHIDIDDDTANKLRELDLPGVYKYAAKVLETTVKELTDAYQHLNPGMQRMNLGNRVRRHFKMAAEVNADLKNKKAA